MSALKILCFIFLIGISLIFNASFAQEDMSADDMYKKAEQYYDKKDYKNAMQWHLKAADKDNGTAMARIGLQYQLGLGIKQDFKQALEWYLKAIDNKGTGIDVADAQLMYLIGEFYFEGQGVEQDYRQAMQWYLRAADKGNADAMLNIAFLYAKGKGVKRDCQKAEQWYLKAKEAQGKE